MYVYIYIYTYSYIYKYIHTYMHIQRYKELETERERQSERESCITAALVMLKELKRGNAVINVDSPGSKFRVSGIDRHFRHFRVFHDQESLGYLALLR